MKKRFVKNLTKLAEKDRNVYLLTADLGFNTFEEFMKKFPDQFINCGVAEQNMMGVAAGMAMQGKKPYVYSIVPFVTMRCLEQIKNDVCYQNLNIKIVGVGGGFSYGSLGATHYALEDIAILRCLPNMVILNPADIIEMDQLIEESYKTDNPTYIRLNRCKAKSIYKEGEKIKIGEASVLKKGRDGVFITTGAQLEPCLEAAINLEKQNYSFKVISMHTLKPIKKESLLKEIRDYDIVLTFEEHNIIGGLGSAIAEILAESNWRGAFQRIGVPDEYPSIIGSSEFLRKKYNLTKDKIIKYIKKNYAK